MFAMTSTQVIFAFVSLMAVHAEFTVADSDTEEDIPATDSTKFELIHKPNKKPFVKDPTPTRKVIRPKR